VGQTARVDLAGGPPAPSRVVGQASSLPELFACVTEPAVGILAPPFATVAHMRAGAYNQLREGRRVNYRARVLVADGPEARAGEITAVGADGAAAHRLARTVERLLLRLERVQWRTASALVDEARAAGAECVLSPLLLEHDDRSGPVLLIGDADACERVAEAMCGGDARGRSVGRQISEALAGWSGEALLPLRCGGRELELAERTLVMGIINVTPDSFSGDGIAHDPDAALRQAERLVEDGADILDVGGQSTRPGSDPVSEEEEIARTLPAVEAICGRLDVVVSIDTARPEVARLAIEAGAVMVNDVRGLRAEGMIELVAETSAAACIMHMRGAPRDMQAAPRYDDLMTEIYGFLADRVDAAVAGGVERDRLLVDPGFGFGKTINHNLEILRRLGELRCLGLGVVIGTSRKSTIGKVLDAQPDERVFGTAATCAVAIANGANIIRVHDVRQMVQVARMTDAVMRGWHKEQ